MKIQADINVDALRKMAWLIINKTQADIRKMSDEELVLACVKNSLYCADNDSIKVESEE